MYKIVMDSSCELNENMLKDVKYDLVPFKITIDDETFVDDENLDMEYFLKLSKETKSTIRSSCPSPNDFLEKLEGDNIFIITITSMLSGSYQSALIAKEMYLEKNPNAKVHVFDSRKAISGETGVALFIADRIKEGKSFDEIVRETKEYINRSVIIINLASLENLAKNGRIPRIAGKLSKVLNIRLLATEKEGKISPVSLERGLKKSVNSMFKKAVELCDKTLKTAIIISHMNAIDAANNLKDMFDQTFPDRLIEITGMKALSSTYAEEGGLVVHL